MQLALVRVGVVALCCSLLSCAAPDKKDEGQRKFYTNQYVRQCLQYEKEKLVRESRGCWERLLQRVEGEDGFRDEQEFTESDVIKIRKRMTQTGQATDKLKQEWDKCLGLSSRDRDKRMACFKDYLARRGDELTRAARYEVEQSIAALEQAAVRAAGNIEATIEHAGKLLGAQLHDEDDGIRIDAVTDGPLGQAKVAEQGIIVAIDGEVTAGLTSAERIARLETCEEREIKLLVRHGGLQQVSFTRAVARCGEGAAGRQISHATLPAETCTTQDSPELRFGLSWCYRPRDGSLNVEEVCADSPAAKAGALPEQVYLRVNGELLLGKGYVEIAELLKTYPEKPLKLLERGGTLASPAPISGPALDASKREECWKAIAATLEKPAGGGGK